MNSLGEKSPGGGRTHDHLIKSQMVVIDYAAYFHKSEINFWKGNVGKF